MVKQLYATARRFDLTEVLTAIGFKPEAGDSFEKLAKDWYSRSRPGRVLSIKDDGDRFDHMIVDFAIKYGTDFWPKQDRGHCLNNGSSAYRPASWRKGEHISFLFPRDSICRGSRGAGRTRVRNVTQAVLWEEQVDS
jgi:hypothetical protein